jgi:hypothetical protein
MTNEQLRSVPILRQLPYPRNGAWSGIETPSQLIGATIHNFGTCENEPDEVEGGGGLVIEYTPKGSTNCERLIFSFDERSMWVAFDSAK